jgi:hypothetical protein
VLAWLERAPRPSIEINPGVRDRLLREDLAEVVELPNPYPSCAKKRPNYPHLKITEAGRQALATRPK